MRRNVEASSKPSIVVIVLDKYQPAPPTYHLSVSTQAAEMSGQSGDTKDASDTISLSTDGSKTENVNGTATLHWPRHRRHREDGDEAVHRVQQGHAPP